MATSGSVFSETLQEITNTKLDELSKRRQAFEEAKTSLLASFKVEDAVERLVILSQGVKKAFDIKLDENGKVKTLQTKHPRLETELKNLDRFLAQAKCDPSVSVKMMDNWEKSLLRHLDTQSLKFQYASLYGQLVTEWLAGDDGEEKTSDDVEMGEPFEDVGDAKKLESRMEWEKMVFEPAKVDKAELANYLDSLFAAANDDSKGIPSALEQLRAAVRSFEADMSKPNQINTVNLRWVIRGLHSSELLSNEKREVLKDFESNSIVLHEIADVLNMRLSALSSWTWNSGTPVPVELRRKISGVYNISMHEDLLQAIFLQYVGVKWSVFFKHSLTSFRRHEGAWKSMRKDISNVERRRLNYYLGQLRPSPSLQDKRMDIYGKKYFMARLMTHDEQNTEHIEGEEEAEVGLYVAQQSDMMSKNVLMAMAPKSDVRSGEPQRRGIGRGGAMRHRKVEAESDDAMGFGLMDESYHVKDDDDGDDNNNNPMELKQTLLHLLSTELTINTRLYGEMTAFHSVFESWTALLPHDTVCTVLQYFGVSDLWLEFFRKFLQAPLKFVDDSSSTAARKRLRGTPTAHVLSDVFGETSLFCLDFAINQATSGAALWRIHDDFWFWSRDHQVAVEAWKTVERFASVTGTELNGNRSGTVRVPRNKDETLAIDRSLPQGEIRWGFLRLSPQTGQFTIDQHMVDAHIDELQKQLEGKRGSILAFIQAWNTYAATFFTSNFGKAANCFGRQHVDNMLATNEHIQREVFSRMPAPDGDSGGRVSSVAEYLKKAIGQRFGIKDVPDGYLYFPMELGGLDVESPFVSLLQIRDAVPEVPSALLGDFEKAERRLYDKAKESFEERRAAGTLDAYDWAPESAQERDDFMSFDEFTQYREEFSFNMTRVIDMIGGAGELVGLHDVFKRLMKRPQEESIDPDDCQVWTAIDQLSEQSNLRGIFYSWQNMEPYWRWIAMMYGTEIIDAFGGLNVVDPGLLPMGMVTLFRDKRVQW